MTSIIVEIRRANKPKLFIKQGEEVNRESKERNKRD